MRTKIRLKKRNKMSRIKIKKKTNKSRKGLKNNNRNNGYDIWYKN
jgi:hypothetical protein